MSMSYNNRITPPNRDKNPSVSVIIPVYNAQKTLEKCISSVLDNNQDGLEIILVDDGSTDGSDEICDRYADSISYVRVVHKKNGGVSTARNVGLNIARGHWVAFVDADDLVTKSFFADASKFSSDLICYNWSYETGDTFQNYRDADYSDKVLTAFLESHLVDFMFRCPWGKLFKRAIIENNNLRFHENLFFGEDTLFILDYLQYCHQITTISQIGYLYTCPASAKWKLPPSYSIRYIEMFMLAYERLGVNCPMLLMQQEYCLFEEFGSDSVKGWIARERCMEVRKIQKACWNLYSWKRKVKILGYRILAML